MITQRDYWMNRDKTHAQFMRDEIRANAEKLLISVNKLIKLAELDGIQFELNPKTGTPVSSGWRPPLVNASTKGSAVRSKHLIGLAVDIYDPDGCIDEWCMYNDQVLAECGIWLEHPSATKGWSHWQCVPPGSGRRIFYP